MKNRLHLDVRVTERSWPQEQREGLIRSKVAELVGAGAVVLDEAHWPDDRLDHVVLQDPEGNEFCVV